MRTVLGPANLGLRFLLELCLLAALAYGGWHMVDPLAGSITLAIALPLLAAVIWGRYLSPRAAVAVRDPWRLLIELVLFAAAVALLALAGQTVLAWILAIAIAVSDALAFPLGQRERAAVANRADRP